MARGLLVVALILVGATCRLDKLIVGPQGALLAVTPSMPDSLADSAAFGSTAIRVDSALISNEGGGELSWAATIKNASPWLSLDTASGVAPYYLKVLANPAGLDSAVYRDTVVVSSTVGGGALEVPVRFDVYPCRITPIALDGSITDSLTTADCGAPHRSGRFAQLYSFNAAVTDSVSIELTGTHDGYLVLDSTADMTKDPFLETDDCLGAPTDPCLLYVNPPRSRDYYVEVTSRDSGETGAFTLRVLRPRLPNPPDSLDQRAIVDSTTPVDTGGFVSQGSIVLRALVSDPDLGDTLHLEAEVKPVGTNFNGSVTATGDSVLNGSPAYVLQTSLLDNTGYHWRVRAVDQTGRAGNWLTFGGNQEDAPDFSVDQPEPPDNASGLGQFEGDSSAPIGLGDNARSDTVVLVATVRDNDPDDQLRLLVEVKPIGTNFNGTVTDSSALVPNNSLAAVRLGPNVLQNNTSYHWRARVVDQTGRMSASWVSYGGNGELATDFRIQIPNRPTFAGHNQYQSDGSTLIPQGADANIPTVIFKATVSDPDVGQTIRLEVEVQPSTVGFTNVATAQSTPVSIGQVASVSVTSPAIVAGGGYHWQARAVDNTNFPSGWVPFPGALPDTGVDFRVAVAISELVFTTQPAVDTAGRPIRPNVVVAARDVNHNVVTGFNGPITMSISTNPASGTLSGTPMVNAVAGIATFNNLVIDKAGTGYKLRATTGTINSLESNAFNVVAAPATQLAFTTHPPASTVAGVNMNPAIVVTAQDQFANAATSFTGPVTLVITPGTGPGGATLNGGGPFNAVGGVATFSTANITKMGTGYRLTASSGALTPDTSNTFTITHAPATHLAYAVHPSNAPQSVPIAPAIQVAARDQFENDATTHSGSVTLSIAPGTGTAGAVLSNGGPIALSSGVAAFPNASINLQGTGYRLNAALTGLTSAQSNPFDITQGTVSAVNSTVQASPATINACSVGCSPGALTQSTITVTARDGSAGGGAVVSGASVTLTVTGTGNTVFPTVPVLTNASGVATFTLNSTVATVPPATELKIISAIISSISINQRDTVAVNPDVAASLVFTTQPVATTAGLAINSGSGGVVITARDQFGNTATSYTANVTMAIAAGPVGGVFTPTSTTTVPAAMGVATFTNLRIRMSGAGYQLQASSVSPALTSPLSNAFTINPAPPNQLTFTTQPTNTAVLARIDSAVGGVVVTVQDSVGNTTPSFAGQVRIILGTTAGGTLTGGGFISTTLGVATFPNLTLNVLGTYSLVTTSTGPSLSSDESVLFDIIPGPAKTLEFSVQPTQTVAGQVITPSPQVRARDIQGNIATGFTGNVTVAIGTNGGTPPGTLSGTTTQAAVNGVAAFPGLNINNAGPNYTLTAATPALPSGPVTGATSNPFNIVAGGVNAGTSTVGAAPSPITACAIGCTTGGGTATLVTVTARDFLSNPISGASTTITVSGTGNTITPAGAVLTDGFGRATWTVNSTLAETKTITAVSGGVSITQQASVGVNAAAAKTLLFNVQPNNTVATQIIRPALGVQVEVRDTFNNRVTNASNSVNIAILNNPATPIPGTLSGTTPRTPVGGIVTFNDLSIDKVGTGYTLLTSSTGLVSATSAAFDITFGAATKLGFFQQPTSTSGGATITPNITVEVQDAGGNRVTSASNAVTLAILNNPSSGTLTGDNMNNAISGVASFGGLSIDNAGTGYTLQATAAGLTSGTSAAFDITVGGATKLGFVQQPSGGTGGATLSAVTVEIQDAGGNRVLGATNPVTLAIGVNPGPGAVLTGGGATAAVNGLATFSSLSIDSAGTGYTLVATSGILTSATSNTFNITVGAATKLGFRVPPSNTAAGASIPTIEVEVQDAGGNRVTSAANAITLAIGTNPGPNGTLSGDANNNAASGLASFPGLSIDSAGNGYTLVATAGGLTQATSTAFNITVGSVSAAQSTIVASQSSITACDNTPPCTTGGGTASLITVTARDGSGNAIAGASVSLAATGTQNFFSPSGSLTTDGSGVATATFRSTVAEAKTISATISSVSINQTAGVTVNAAAADHLVFTVQPTNTQAGQTISAVVVEIRDAFDNLVTAANDAVTLAITSGTGTPLAQLSGMNPQSASGGIATFNDLSIDLAGIGYTLDATASGLTGTVSATFNITP